MILPVAIQYVELHLQKVYSCQVFKWTSIEMCIMSITKKSIQAVQGKTGVLETMIHTLHIFSYYMQKSFRCYWLGWGLFGADTHARDP